MTIEAQRWLGGIALWLLLNLTVAALVASGKRRDRHEGRED